MKSVIEEAINDSKNLNDQSLTWDFIKCKIRTETITFSINNKKKVKEEDINMKEAHGSFIRSRCKAIDEFEKPSKYFLNLEKKNHNPKSIHSLVYNGQKITKSEEIMKIHFSRLYSSNELEDSKISKCKNSSNIR